MWISLGVSYYSVNHRPLQSFIALKSVAYNKWFMKMNEYIGVNHTSFHTQGPVSKANIVYIHILYH